MVTCAVISCKNSSTKISKNKNGITFHRFPRDKQRRRQWEIAVNRMDDWTATACSTVCSEHFEANDFYLTEHGLRRLSVSAVPSINISPCQQREPTIRKIEPIQIASTDTPEVIKLKHKVRRLEILAEERKRRYEVLWRSKQCMSKKLDRMKTMIKHLIKIKKENVIGR